MENRPVHPGPSLPRIFFEIGISQKGCSRTYNKLMEHDHHGIQEVKERWERVLNEDIVYATVKKVLMLFLN